MSAFTIVWIIIILLLVAAMSFGIYKAWKAGWFDRLRRSSAPQGSEGEQAAVGGEDDY